MSHFNSGRWGRTSWNRNQMNSFTIWSYKSTHVKAKGIQILSLILNVFQIYQFFFKITAINFCTLILSECFATNESCWLMRGGSMLGVATGVEQMDTLIVMSLFIIIIYNKQLYTYRQSDINLVKIHQTLV